MKKIYLPLLLYSFFVSISFGTGYKVISLKGTVSIRHGVQEQWNALSVGDVLKPEDSIELQKKSSAKILIDGKKVLTLPESVILDLADLRDLTQDGLLLMLAWEQVRALPLRDEEKEIEIPRTTTIHGRNMEKDHTTQSSTSNKDIGLMQLNGTKVLFENGYYATCILRSKEVLRIYPELKNQMETRLRVAISLEKMKLDGEAVSAYEELLQEQLIPPQRSEIERKIKQLKKEN